MTELAVRILGMPVLIRAAYAPVVFRPKGSKRPVARIRLTEEGERFRRMVQTQLLAARLRVPDWPRELDSYVCEIECVYYFDSRRPDVDGPGKLILDALQGAVVANDRQISDFIQRKRLSKKAPFFEVHVRVLGESPLRKRRRSSPQEALFRGDATDRRSSL